MSAAVPEIKTTAAVNSYGPTAKDQGRRERIAEWAKVYDLLRLFRTHVVCRVMFLLKHPRIALVGLLIAFVQAATDGRIRIPEDAALGALIVVEPIQWQLLHCAILFRSFDGNSPEACLHQPRLEFQNVGGPARFVIADE
jgi:hypothetical protein